MAHEMRNQDWSAQVQRLSPVLPTAPALLIGGMHRSGTSALTRVLALAGADLPRTLMPAGSDNPLGFWESLPIAEVNNAVLAEIGLHWDDVFAFDSRPEAAGLRQSAVARIRHVVQAEFEASAMPVIKDPRLSLLIPVWDMALREVGHSAYAIGVVRHPMEVAQSLMKRDGFPIAKSLLLWLAYFIAFERDTRGLPRVFVAYDDLLADWRGALDRVEKRLGVFMPRRGHASDLEIERFLTREGRHHHAGAEALQRDDVAAAWLRTAYDWACRAAREEKEPDTAELDAIRLEMSRTAGAYAPVVVDLTQRLDKAVREAEGLQQLREEMAALKAEHDRLSTDRAIERRTAAATISGLQADLDTDRTKARAEIARIENEREAERQAAGAERQRLEAELERERIAAKGARDRLEAEQEKLRAETTQRLVEAQRDTERLEADYFALQDEMDALSARLPEMERALAQARKATLLMQAQRDEETSRANGLAGEREAMQHFLATHMAATATLRRALWKQRWLQPVSDVMALVNLSLSRGPRQAMQALHMARAIRGSELFDADYYVKRYWDVGALGHDPVLHYVVAGAREMRDPSPAFSTRGYIERHGDVARLGDPPLYHYVSHGRAEGRLPVRTEGAPTPPQAPATVEPVAAVPPPAAPPPAQKRLWRRRRAAQDARNPNDPYRVRPDDSVPAEEKSGADFCYVHRLMGADPDFASAVEEINRLFTVNTPAGADATPDASIVIPVYGQLPYTLNCLHALAQQRSRYSFEIIVVDDCSPDASAIWLGRIGPVRLLRQPQNGGFIESCNAGAKLARGRFYVMLNNDTRVCAGWLDELIGSFDVLPDAGLVGSKLFYPDGSLQEAGGILWRDGSAWNYGRNEDPGNPAYSYARSVDYVSGASIAVPKDIWEKLGGFDTHYRPAYGEDSDLALKVRYQLGRGVWMQPLSRVIHYEGKTSGTDTSTGVKAYQVANAEKLRERWKDKLATHRPNGELAHLERDRGRLKRALVLDATTPEPDKDAGSLTCFELMRALQANGYKVTFLAESNLLYLPGPSSGLQRIGVEVGYAPYIPSIDGWLQAHGREVDVVMLFRNGVAARQIKDVRRHCPNARVIFHSSDLHFLREEREAMLGNDAKMLAQAQETRKSELALIRSADATIVHSSYEEEVLREAAPGANVAVFPWILDPKACDTPFSKRQDIAFLGGYRHPPNADAVRYFVQAIWPLVRAKNPDMRFIIAGSEMPDDLAAMGGKDNVVAQGYVPDLGDFFETIRLTVAPIRYGAGIKGKVAMSFAYGVPAVLTPCAAEGMGLVDGDISLTREDPQEFADAILALYADEPRWTRMSAGALDFVERTYGSALGYKRIAEIIASADIAAPK